MVLRRRLPICIAILLVLSLVLAACGNTQPAGTQGGADQAAATAASPGDAVATEAPAPAETEAAATTGAEAAETPAAGATGAETATAGGTPAGGAPAAGEPDKDPRDNVLAPDPIPAGMFPLTEEKVTLRVALPSNTGVEDFNTNKFTQWYEEQTNVHV